MSGSKHAIENGVTTQTEKMIGGGGKSNPNLQLNNKEQEYVISQLIQKNYDTRRGLSVFKSRTGRSSLIQGVHRGSQIPPVGQYEHQYNKGHFEHRPKTVPEFSVHTVPQKYVTRPEKKVAVTQAFSCFAETPIVDFTKSQTRDDVSFYKHLARAEKAKRLGMSLVDYEKIIRLKKTKRMEIKVEPTPSSKINRVVSENNKSENLGNTITSEF